MKEKKQSIIGIVLKAESQEVLVVKRRDVPMWVFPGGGVDPQETPEEAVCREVFEETGLIIAIDRKSGCYTPVNTFTQITHVFVAHSISGKPSATDETKEVCFAPLNQLPSPFFPLHKIWLDEALNHPHQCINRPITEVTWISIFKYFFQHPFYTLRFLFAKCGVPWNSK